PDTPVRRVEHVRRAAPEPRERRPLVYLDPIPDRRIPERAREPRRLHGRALAEEDSSSEARRGAALGQLRTRERHRFLLDPALAPFRPRAPSKRRAGGGRIPRGGALPAASSPPPAPPKSPGPRG